MLVGRKFQSRPRVCCSNAQFQRPRSSSRKMSVDSLYDRSQTTARTIDHPHRQGQARVTFRVNTNIRIFGGADRTSFEFWSKVDDAAGADLRSQHTVCLVETLCTPPARGVLGLPWLGLATGSAFYLHFLRLPFTLPPTISGRYGAI